MSDIRKTKNAAYDQPEGGYLPGQLQDVYAVIDDSLDNGELAYGNLRQAKDIGRKTLQAFENMNEEWSVYVDLTPQVRIEREGVPAYASNLLRGATNTYGSVTDIDIIKDIDGRFMLGAIVESSAIGQHDRYIVPLARQGDKEVLKGRPVDMPSLRRNLYKERLNSTELKAGADLYDLLGSKSITGAELMEYIQENTTKKKEGGFNRYITALNLEVEDTFSSGDPYQVTIYDGTIVVDYDQSFTTSAPYFEYPQGDAFSLLGIHCVRNHSKRQVQEVSLALVSDNNDLVATVQLDHAKLTLSRDEHEDDD